jgi:hypothetical protein
VYRSWELDKGQILQCTGAGNWTKVRYYSVQELGTGQRSDITVYRSWELDKGQILQCTGAGNWTKVRYYSAGARNWTEVRYYNLRPKIDHISANSKHNSKRL